MLRRVKSKQHIGIINWCYLLFKSVFTSSWRSVPEILQRTNICGKTSASKLFTTAIYLYSSFYTLSHLGKNMMKHELNNNWSINSVILRQRSVWQSRNFKLLTAIQTKHLLKMSNKLDLSRGTSYRKPSLIRVPVKCYEWIFIVLVRTCTILKTPTSCFALAMLG